MRLSSDPRVERAKGLDAAEKQPVMSIAVVAGVVSTAVAVLVSPPSLDLEPVLPRRDDHLLGKDRDLLGPGDEGDPPRVWLARSGLADETRLSRINPFR